MILKNVSTYSMYGLMKWSPLLLIPAVSTVVAIIALLSLLFLFDVFYASMGNNFICCHQNSPRQCNTGDTRLVERKTNIASVK